MKKLILAITFILFLSGICFSNYEYHQFLNKFTPEKLPFQTITLYNGNNKTIQTKKLSKLEIKKYIPSKSEIIYTVITPYKKILKLYNSIDLLIYNCFFDSGDEDFYLITYNNGKYVDLLCISSDIDHGIARLTRDSTIEATGKIKIFEEHYTYTYDENNPENTKPISSTKKTKNTYYQILKNGKISLLKHNKL